MAQQKNDSIEKLRKILKAVRKTKPFYRQAEVEREIRQQKIMARSRKRRDYERHMDSSEELTSSEIRMIEKNCREKEWKLARMKMTLAAVGLATVIGGGVKAISAGTEAKADTKRPTVEIEVVKEDGTVVSQDEFRKSLEVKDAAEVDNSKEPDLTPEEKAIMESDAVINAIVNAYNDKYDTRVNSENVKVLETNPIYISESAEGDLVLDEWRKWDVAELNVGTGTVYTLIDGDTNEIIYSAIKQGRDVYDINTHIVKSWKGQEFVNHHEQGDFLRAEEISFDKTIQGNSTPQGLAYRAIGTKLDRILNPEKYEAREEKGDEER